MKKQNAHIEKWEKCLEIIRNNVDEVVFKNIFATMEYEQYSEAGRTLLIKLPSQYIFEHLEEHFAPLMNAVLRRVFKTDVILKYRILAGNEDKPIDMQPDKMPSLPASNVKKAPQKAPSVIDAVAQDDIDPQLSRMHTFHNFIVGEANRAAREIGYVVAQNPNSTQFNPLFIYGPSGCGKTHLINAIGVHTKENFPEKRVLYVSARLFQAQFVDARLTNEINSFFAFYQRIDLLIVDDIQEWETSPKTVDAFYHIFNHLHRNGKRIILASDRPPVELTWLSERLITRFSWGVTLEIGKPDQQLCRDILKAKIKRDGLDIPDDVINYIAQTAQGSVRHLEGIINSLMAYA
ncbi:MAG: ATP-binding protein, partial [Prevotella sp.]|nr:ATP-binding protein [Prevotella sp.]